MKAKRKVKKRTLISEDMAGCLPTRQAAVPKPISVRGRRFLPHVTSLKLPTPMIPLHPLKMSNKYSVTLCVGPTIILLHCI